MGHLAFFNTHVSRWLGPAPAVNTESGRIAAAYASALTADHTPLEISYSWKGGAPVSVRYVADMVPHDAKPTRAASLAAASQAIDGLRDLGPHMDLLPDLWASVTAQLAHLEHDIHPTNGPRCRSCGPSSVFIGFDLEHARARAKLYWLLPACLPAVSLLALLDTIFARCLAEGHLTQLPRFAMHWAQVRSHLFSHMQQGLLPRMLSVDASRYPFPRVKIYTRCYLAADESFDVIEAHLSLRGGIQPPRDQYAALWACVQEKCRLHAQRQRYCIIAHDIFPAPHGHDGLDSGITSKLYLLCDQIPGHDGFVTRELLARFPASAKFFRRCVPFHCQLLP